MDIPIQLHQPFRRHPRTFCEYCDEVGVEWRVMNRWTISVAKRDSVASMDRFIGPKR